MQKTPSAVQKFFYIGTNPTLHGKVVIGNNTVIGNYASIGFPKEYRLIQFQKKYKALRSPRVHDPYDNVTNTTIGQSCRIGSQIIIYEGSVIDNNVTIDDFARIGYDCRIEDNTRVIYGAFICDRVQIGKNCVIAGFLCDGTRIKENAIVTGNLVHELTKPHLPWEDVDEPSPTVEASAVIGFGATIVGGITIGHHAYITAGALVTKDVPPKHIVIGTNRMIPHQQWKGEKLSRDFFEA